MDFSNSKAFQIVLIKNNIILLYEISEISNKTKGFYNINIKNSLLLNKFTFIYRAAVLIGEQIQDRLVKSVIVQFLILELQLN